jgi:hypothetical protein
MCLPQRVALIILHHTERVSWYSHRLSSPKNDSLPRIWKCKSDVAIKNENSWVIYPPLLSIFPNLWDSTHVVCFPTSDIRGSVCDATPYSRGPTRVRLIYLATHHLLRFLLVRKRSARPRFPRRRVSPQLFKPARCAGWRWKILSSLDQ